MGHFKFNSTTSIWELKIFWLQGDRREREALNISSFKFDSQLQSDEIKCFNLSQFNI